MKGVYILLPFIAGLFRHYIVVCRWLPIYKKGYGRDFQISKNFKSTILSDHVEILSIYLRTLQLPILLEFYCKFFYSLYLCFCACLCMGEPFCISDFWFFDLFSLNTFSWNFPSGLSYHFPVYTEFFIRNDFSLLFFSLVSRKNSCCSYWRKLFPSFSCLH